MEDGEFLLNRFRRILTKIGPCKDKHRKSSEEPYYSLVKGSLSHHSMKYTDLLLILSVGLMLIIAQLCFVISSFPLMQSSSQTKSQDKMWVKMLYRTYDLEKYWAVGEWGKGRKRKKNVFSNKIPLWLLDLSPNGVREAGIFTY